MSDEDHGLRPSKDVMPSYRPRPVRRVLLIYPFAVGKAYQLETVLKGGAFVEAPLGIGYISSYISEHVSDIEVEVFDANAMAIKHILATRRVDMPVLWEMLETKVRDFAPDLVGVSCLFHNIAATAHNTCDAVVRAAPKAIVVMGGNYPTGSPNVALSSADIHFLLYSEGEKSLAALIGALREGKEPAALIDGIAYRPDVMPLLMAPLGPAEPPEPKHPIRQVPKGAFTKSLEEYPWPDRRHFDMEFYATYARHFAFRTLDRSQVRLATMTASRGCPFKCTFCSSKDFWGKQIRYRDPAIVVDEMEYLIDNYDINTFVFNDDNIMFSRKSILAFCDEMKKRNLRIHWLSGGGIQVSAMKRDVIQALIETGLNQFNLAIETGNPKTLKRIQKPLAGGVAQDIIAEIRRYEGVWIGSNFITGFYFETLDDARETLEYARSLDLDWRSIYSFQPLPGTDDYLACVERGYMKEWDIWDEQIGDLIELTTENFTAKQIRDLNYLANLEYNFLQNRNLQANPAQAIRDFNYVIEIAPDHAISYYVRAQAELALGQPDAAHQSLLSAKEIVNRTNAYSESRFKSNFALTSAELRWSDYFLHFGIDLDAELSRIDTMATYLPAVAMAREKLTDCLLPKGATNLG